MTLAIFTAIQNEGPYLFDWVAHHRALGIESILVYSFEPDDGTLGVLKKLQNAQVITHIPLDDAQPSPFVVAQKRFWDSAARQKADWLLPLDVREYLHIPDGSLLIDDHLKEMPNNTDAIVLSRHIYGSNGLTEIDPKSITSKLKSRAETPQIFPFEATYGKSIVRNKQVFHGIGFFRAKQKAHDKGRQLNMYNCDGEKLPEYYSQHEKRLSIMGSEARKERLVINYYPLRSVGDYIANGYYSSPQHKHSEADLEFWVENNFNNVEDHSIDRFERYVQRERSLIEKQVDGLFPAIDEATKQLQERLERTLLDPKMFDLHNYCLLAQNSASPKRSLAQRLYLQRNKQENEKYQTELESEEKAKLEREKKSQRKKRQRREAKKVGQ